MITFAWPWLFCLLPLPLLIRALSHKQHTAHSYQVAFRAPFFQRAARLNQEITIRKSNFIWKCLMLGLIWGLIIIAAARPQQLGAPLEMPLTGRDIIFAIDVSGSMQTPDFSSQSKKETRLDVVKRVASAFITKRKGDRLALIVFGTQAFVQSPLTFDTKTIIDFLNDSEIGIAGEKTAIGDAIGMTIKHIKKQSAQQKILILLTDGANNEGSADPKHAADIAKEQGLKIYTIGIGAKSMKMNSFFGQQLFNPSADLDEDTLKYIAQTTGGEYFRATDESSLQKIYQQLDDLHPHKSDKEIYRPVHDIYYIPFAAAFIISIIYAFLFTIKFYIRNKHDN